MDEANQDQIVHQVLATEAAIEKLEDALATVSVLSGNFARRIDLSESQLETFTKVLNDFRVYIETLTSVPVLLENLTGSVQQASIGISEASAALSSSTSAQTETLVAAADQLIHVANGVKASLMETFDHMSTSLIVSAQEIRGLISEQASVSLESLNSSLRDSSDLITQRVDSIVETFRHSADDLGLRIQEGIDPVIRAAVRLLSQMEEKVNQVNTDLDEISVRKMHLLKEESSKLGESLGALFQTTQDSLSLVVEQHKGELHAARTREKSVIEAQEKIVTDLKTFLENSSEFLSLSERLSTNQEIMRILSTRVEERKPALHKRFDLAITSTLAIIVGAWISLDVPLAQLLPVGIISLIVITAHEPVVQRAGDWIRNSLSKRD